ncbi:heterokaryon incompatibility protein-domain-containing protein, partial [Sordaria sp. MPI-SDFR-AT-0083]
NIKRQEQTRHLIKTLGWSSNQSLSLQKRITISPRSITIRETSPPYIQHQYTSQQLYSHLPLPQHPSPTKAIRVLDLDPVPLSSINNPTSRISLDQQPLAGTLRTIDFATCPNFTALSYVWGAPANDDSIIIRCDDSRGHGNGGTCKIPITRNCRDALVSLRKLHSCSSRNRDSGRANESKEANEQVLTVWVDAICINQQDEREKPGQIALMGEVYTWASKVWVWLGPTCPNITPRSSPTRHESDFRGERKVKRAIIGLKRAAKLRATPPGMPWIDSSMHGKQQGYGPRTTFQDALLASRSLARVFVRLWLRETFAQLKTYLIMCYACFTSAHASDLLETNDLEYLLDREWLHRAWTFQEIILASNPIILCGDESIT